MRDLLAVIFGGMLGTALRLGIELVLPHGETGFPASTLLVNTVGAFVLAVLVGRVWPTAAGWLKAGLGAGLLGSFTTFSAVAVSVVALANAAEWMPALAYLATTVVAGLAAAFAGLHLGRRRARQPTIDLVNE